MDRLKSWDQIRVTVNAFYANCKYQNWEHCKKYSIFGLKSARIPDIAKNDLVILRVTGHTGEKYGVKGLWLHERIEKVIPSTFVPWEDGPYEWIIHAQPIAEFLSPLSEEFATTSKVSQKIDSLFATRIMGSLGALKPIETRAYIEFILKQNESNLKQAREDFSWPKIQQKLLLLLRSVDGLEEGDTTSRVPVKSKSKLAKEIPPRPYGVVGERIDLPILNYAPLNEMGVILLFGYYLKDLGFSHLEEIRAGFPDAIGMQKIDDKRYRRVRIEFEFHSRSFQLHNHPLEGCDIIVCWEHDWKDCPIEVIELKSALFSN